VELARTRGLGVIGEGAPAATRALLVALLAARHRPPHDPADDPTDAAAAGPIEVLIPADALDAVLPGVFDKPGRPLPARLRATRDLDSALDVAETELLTRARLSAERRSDLGTLVILAVPQQHARQRLQAVLDNGSTLGVAGILLGQWHPGGTVRVRSDGTIAAASPDIAASLDQARLFTLPTDSTRTLLDLLAAADAPAEHTDALHHADPMHPAHPDDTDTDTDATATSPDGDAPDNHRPDGATGPARPRRPEGDHLTVIRTDATADPSSPTAYHAKPDGARATTAMPADRTVSVLRPVPRTRTREALSQDPLDLDLDPDRTNLELAPAVGGSTTRPSDAPARGSSSAAGRRHQPDGRPASPHPASRGVTDKTDLWRPSAALRLTVLGRLQLQHRPPAGRTRAASSVDVIGALAPRQREVLVYLALNPDGARRESLAAAIWPDAPVERPYNSFHATLSLLRKALSKAIDDSTTKATSSSASSTTTSTVGRLILHGDGRYRLDRDLVDVDLWHLSDTLAAARTTAPDRLDALRRVPELYRGDLAEDLTAEWLAARRETLRRQVLDALSTLIHSVPGDPQQVLVWLDQARDLDPYNEAIYQDLIRTQGRLGQRDAIVRTLDLLATTLADIDRQPAPTTRALAESLAAPRTGHRESE
jgi:DNA-binding SARP family transcriptional activator